MADIYVAVWNQDKVAMSSVNGELIVILVIRDGLFQAQRQVMLRSGTAIFQNLPAGLYTIIARHPDLTPTEARCDVNLSEGAIFGIRFTYNEVQRQLLTIETEESSLS
ncbi:MAG: hypothetical protein OHK0047_10410 [Leptolyngbyaceae cyanobacterium]